jgi:hypothetical protein
VSCNHGPRDSCTTIHFLQWNMNYFFLHWTC